jgi:hypothetical protein
MAMAPPGCRALMDVRDMNRRAATPVAANSMRLMAKLLEW